MEASSITLRDLIHAAKKIWGGEHIAASETTDGIQTVVAIVGEPRGVSEILIQADTRAELLKRLESRASDGQAVTCGI